LRPECPEQLAQALADCASEGHSIQLSGCDSKRAMGGPVEPADATISTAAMTKVLQYEPADLTISVEAGMRWADLTALLAANQQMIPLDPPFAESATVGGVVAANTSGPRRRLYGTARDVIIGMKFATLGGKLVQSGGMVVKNVAGLDMGKLMIGSFGTLAAVAVVNFKIAPMPPTTRTFILPHKTLEEAAATRDRVLQSVLQPAALDMLNPSAAARVGLEGYCVILQVGGSDAVMERYTRELTGAVTQSGDELWTRIREFAPNWLRDYPEGAVVRLSTTLKDIPQAMASASGPVLARAGTGVVYVYYDDAEQATVGTQKGAVEFAPEGAKRSLTLWPAPGSDFSVMQKIKRLFDPKLLLNRGRLYGRI
jgi:glycolate oxidase FAD binding subunit